MAPQSEFDRLRDLLLAEDRLKHQALSEQLQRLDERLEELPSLPGALEKPATLPRVGRALAPPVSEALRQIAHQNPGFFVSILFPVIGPIIRRAIADSIASLLKNLNRTLEHSFSWQGLKWRMEAMRTGVSFGRIVLKHSLAYRVEHLFWIENGSGLLLAHAANAGALQADKDAVAGMLTAIADFVRDAVLARGNESLDRVELGELSVRLLRAPEAYLAVVLRGEPPAEVFGGLAELLESLHGELPVSPRDYLPEAETRLNLWLEQSGRAEALRQDEQPPWKALTVVAVVLLLAVGWFTWRAWQERERESVRSALEAVPGVRVEELRRDGELWRVTGVRDPLAASDETLAGLPALRGSRVEGTWRNELSWEPEIIAERIRQRLTVPLSVKVTVVGGTVRIAGLWRAPPDGLEAQLDALETMFSIDRSALEFEADPELRAQWLAVLARVGQFAVHFGVEDQPREGDVALLDALVEDLRLARTLSERLELPLRLQVLAHADASGSLRTNQRVTAARAQWLHRELIRRGVDFVALTSEFEIDPPDVEKERARRVRIVVGSGP